MVASITQTLSAEATRTAAHRVRSRADALHDAGLVRRFNSGDNGAFSEIVRRHRAKMHQVALGLLKNHADAEEIAQDTFIRGYRGLANFRGDSSLATKAEARTRQLARRVSRTAAPQARNPLNINGIMGRSPIIPVQPALTDRAARCLITPHSGR